MIRATIKTTDGALSFEFDATRFFQTAADDEIMALHDEDFGDGDMADFVAETIFHERHDGIGRVFKYVDLMQQAGAIVADAGQSPPESVGTDVRIDREDALGWLFINRPRTVEKIIEEGLATKEDFEEAYADWEG